MKRLIGILTALGVVVTSGGCIVLPYGYPRFEHLPDVAWDDDANEVRAFLVTRTHNWDSLKGFKYDPDRSSVTESIEEIPLAGARKLESTWKTMISDGHVGLILLFMPTMNHSYQTTELRFYRPGYELVVVKPWDSAKTIHWRPLSTVAEREEALNHLSGDSSRSSKGITPEARRAILFFAAEYENLISISQSAYEKDRMMLRARQLRKDAGWEAGEEQPEPKPKETVAESPIEITIPPAASAAPSAGPAMATPVAK